jgi:multidrug efflux pump subunit AcrA (membrane-fusion protein)
VTPTGYPTNKLAGKVTAVTILPPGPGQFTVLVDVDGDAGPVMPGMTCSLKVVAYDKADALVVPASTVFAEDDDEDSRYVYLQREGADPLKRSVTVGRQKGDDLEILSGLAAGDVVLAEEPADKE